ACMSAVMPSLMPSLSQHLCHPETAGAARVLDPLALRGVAAEDDEGSLTTTHMPHASQTEILPPPPPVIVPGVRAAWKRGSGCLRMTGRTEDVWRCGAARCPPAPE